MVKNLFLLLEKLCAEIQAGTKRLCEFAFARCKGLSEITIPESVTTIEQYAFAFCSPLKHVYVPYGEIKVFRKCFQS